MVAVTPQQQAAVERLRRWALSEGGIKHFKWGTDGDMTRCQRFYKGKMPARMIDGWCARLHKAATGTWPGERGKPGNAPKSKR
jgi:hypothetical protein